MVTEEIIGAQRPRILYVPSNLDIEAALEAELFKEGIDLVGEAGLVLDEWQQLALAVSLASNEMGKYIAGELGVDVARQNGKGGFLEARELIGLYLVPTERLIVHSAHEFPTSAEHFRRFTALIEDTPRLHKQVKPRGISWSHGSEGVELRNRNRIRFRTRTKAGGRGWSGDLMVLDEAMELPEAAFGSLFPSLSARPNPQVIYTGSAVDKEVHRDGIVFARVRERGLAGTDPSLAWLEWSVDGDDPAMVPDEILDDIEAWAQANPGLNIRISPEFVAKERRALASRTFAVERLGIGDWPATELEGVLNLAAWASLLDEKSTPVDPVVFAADVSPDQRKASIGIAGFRIDGIPHIERLPVEVDGLVQRAAELERKWRPSRWVVDRTGPISAYLPALAAKGIHPHEVTAQEHAQACAMIVNAVDREDGDGLRHLGQPALTQAIKGAAKRPLGDAFAWSRKHSSVDITPLVVCTLALWGLNTSNGASWVSFA